MDYEDKIILEKSIIAELLTDPNSFVKVAGFLTVNNFSEGLYKDIFKACELLYPNTTIEPFTVAEKTGLSVLSLLMEATHELLQLRNIQYRALLLVEISIREQFIKLITKFHTINTEYGSEQAIALSEIIAYSKEEETDIFKSITNTLLFFESKRELYEEEIEEVKEFNENIVKKCEHIRSQHHVKSLYQNLENLYQFDYKKKELLQALNNLTRYVMAHDVHPTVASQIITLSNL